MIRRIFNWFAKYKMHIILWLCYTIYELLVIGFRFDNSRELFIYLCHYTFFIIFFYLNAEVLLPFATAQKRSMWVFIPLILVVQTACYAYGQYLISTVLYEAKIAKQSVVLNEQYLLRQTFRELLYLIFSTAYFLMKRYIKETKKTEELEKQRLNAIIREQEMERELAITQNAYLKAQINPHFLFNTLDFIYHNVNKHSTIAGETIVRLSEMMRFAIGSDEMNAEIPLMDEIEQVEHLIYLHQVKKNNQHHIELSYTVELAPLKFIPLIVLTLVENIFKHGDLSRQDEPAEISLFVADGHLMIYTDNLIGREKSSKSNHAGLNNIKNRLTYAYGDQVEFNYEVTANHHFRMKISIPTSLLV